MCHTTSLLHVLFCDHAHTTAGRIGSNWKYHGDLLLCADQRASDDDDAAAACLRNETDRIPVGRSAKETRGERPRFCRLSFNPSDVGTGFAARENESNQSNQSIRSEWSE
jgi:hypothetical protein